MSNIVSLDETRAARFGEALAALARKGEPAIIERGGGVINARRMHCRTNVVEILDERGEYVVVNYRDIRGVRTIGRLRDSVVSDRGDFLAFRDFAAPCDTHAILPFQRRRGFK